MRKPKHFRFDPELAQKLADHASVTGLTETEIVERALVAHMERSILESIQDRQEQLEKLKSIYAKGNKSSGTNTVQPHPTE